jgi:peptide/nickel transport system substrate-binding protein
MRRATLVTDRAERAQAWADIDAGITRLAPAIPWIWVKQANIRSENVVGTIDEATALWSLAHSRLR